MLTPALDQHCEVSALLIGDPEAGITIEKMIAAFKENVCDALTRFGCKLNGHTRDYLWRHRDDLARPSTVRLSAYAAADSEGAVQVYNAVDSLQAVKQRKHIMQSTLNIAGIPTRSPYMTAATSLAGALNAAVWVLHGGAPEHRTLKLLPPAGTVLVARITPSILMKLPSLA